MPGSSDRRLASKVQIAFGAVLLVAAMLWLAWGLGRMAWLGGLVHTMRVAYSYAAPLVVLSLVVYVIWATMHDAFANMTPREQRLAPPSVDLDDRRISGVCSGIARYFGIDTVFVRVVALGLFALLPFVVGPIYLIATVILVPRF